MTFFTLIAIAVIFILFLTVGLFLRLNKKHDLVYHAVDKMFVEEDAFLTSARQAAIEKMSDAGRIPLVRNGHYNPSPSVLK